MNKFLRTLYIVPLSFLLTGCWTRIWTVTPVNEPVAVAHEKPTVVVVEHPKPTTVYTTTVTTPSPRTTTVTTFTVTGYNTDPCFYLDLNAVAAAFAESRSTREFEQLLNSSRYMINNLDLNHDGWVDYLRVIETYKGYYHATLIQACLAPGVFQDVATIVAERRADRLYVEVVGDPYLYGYNYIVRPVFIKRPPMWDAYGYANYSCWSSPYYYDYYPSYYTKPQPVYLNHYQAYVTTYMTNHHYCHSCDYPQQPFYNGYSQMTQPYSRNDFREQHPDNAFERRVSRSANGNKAVASARNAGQLRTEVSRQSAASSTSQSTTTRTPSTTATTTTRTPSTTAITRQPAASSTTRQAETKTTAVRQANATHQTTTTVETRVNKNGSSRTTVRTTDATGRTQTVKSSQGRSSGSTPRSSQRER